MFNSVTGSGENDEHLSLWKIKVDNETNKTILRPSRVIDFKCLDSRKEDLVHFEWDVTLFVYFG